MRPSVLPVCLLLASGLGLSGCGIDTFLNDTQWYHWNPNRPIGDSENMRRVKGLSTAVAPLKPEEGNVWPGPAAPEPTLQDLERQQNSLTGPPSAGSVAPYAPDHQQPRPGGSLGGGPNGPPPPSPGSTVPGSGPQGQIAPTPRGPAVNTRGTTGGAGGTSSTANGSIVVPNGNGTSTVIAPDGSISTIPTPK